jgi:ABC-2 type transport system ATP-binding protein
MLKIKNLRKSFFSNTILENINLEIEEGKLTTLLGENGCGKSTLLNILSGYELPDEGSVTYKDTSLDSINFSFKHDIFFVHEKINYTLSITVNEYITMLKSQIPNWNEVLFAKMVKDRKIDLNNNFQNFSRGQKMQVALMIGLASSPKILLLDEITSVIDVYGRKYFLDLLEKYVAQGNTVVITTNIINELEFYTDNLVVIKDKEIVLNKNVKDIPKQFIKIRNPGSSEHPIFTNEKCVWSNVNSDKSVSYIIPVDLYNKSEIPKELLDKRKSTLEDVFIYYFSQVNSSEDQNENAA